MRRVRCPVLARPCWELCTRTRETPLGAKGGTQLTAIKETGPQLHGTEFLEGKGFSHRAYKTKMKKHSSGSEVKTGLMQNYTMINFGCFELLKL